jgi:putative phosphoserine phosphatase/1-acylglycerol-3-phosphate O-acyltransferase
MPASEATPAKRSRSRVAAAIFDLDRTLIPGSSAPVIQRHLRAAKLGPEWELPAAEAFYGAYQRFGETWVTMQLARLAARAAKGWSVAAVKQAAEGAADELVGMVQPFVPQLVADHKAAGRRLVLATTTPLPLVGPLAERLGFDDVVATRWAADGETYSGGTDGPFLWGRAKMVAIKTWAKDHGIDLKRSYAYSDSFFDGPLLDAVGHPTAINPDVQLATLARINRWPVRHLDVSPGVVKFAGRELQEILRPLNRPEMVPNARFSFSGVENIPKAGSAILVFNHRSYFDSTAINLLIARSGRPVRFLGKKEVFDAPVIGRFMAMFGGIRVNRASGSDEPLEAAAAALRAGEMVAMAPQGTIPRGPAFFDPELKGRWGAARLAAATRAPVIPVGLWGTEVVWPRSARLPRFRPDRPLITVNVGPPVDLGYEDPDVDTKAIMSAISALLPEEARQHKVPTEAELALTYPPGYKGEAAAEVERRPGTDTIGTRSKGRGR